VGVHGSFNNVFSIYNVLYKCEKVLYIVSIQKHGTQGTCTSTFTSLKNKCWYFSDRISNKDLWKAPGQEDINLEIRKRKFKRIGHTLRKDDREIPKAALFWNPQGNRKRGRPRNSWRRSAIKEAGRSWNELRFLATDRQKWKGLIDNLCS
jgi:hypothetical protein